MSRVDQAAVLLVDDNQATCALVTAILRKEFRVEIATDGVEAIEKLRSSRYAAVLLDIRMPRLDGFAVLKHLESSAPDVIPKVLVFTALGELTLKALDQYPICGIVRKPFDIDELLAVVKQCALGDQGKGRFTNVFAAGPMLLLLADLIRRLL
jgi:DNA-binding response OmpR family regulator